MTLKKILIIFIHALIGWMLCGAIMGIGMSLLPSNNVLIIHLIAAPIFFIIISFIYFKNFNYTSPVTTAIIFTLIIIFMDFFVVALLIIKSLDMFKSIIGTWMPFGLIFLSTLLTGFFSKKK